VTEHLGALLPATAMHSFPYNPTRKKDCRASKLFNQYGGSFFFFSSFFFGLNRHP
jgi:hypothetical protein